MSKFLEMARRHGFGVEEIAEDLTDDKAEESVVSDDTTVAENNDGDTQETDVASAKADEGDAEDKDVDETVPDAKADVAEETAVVSVEDGEDVLAAALSDEAVEDAKRKLAEAAEVLDRFTKEKAKKAPVETHDAELAVSDDLSVSNEGFTGYAAGYLGHLLLNYGVNALLGPLATLGKTVIGVGVANSAADALNKKKQELEVLAKESKKLIKDGGSELVRDGKISKEELNKKIKDLELEDYVLPSTIGSVIGRINPFYGAMVSGEVASQLQDVNKAIKAKNKEIEVILSTLAKKVESPSNEETAEDVIPQAADAETVDSATDKKNEGDNEDGKELKEENETDEVIPEASDAEMLEGKAAVDAAAKDHDEAVSAVEVFEKVEASVEAHYEVVKHCAGRRGIDRHHVLSIGIALEHTLADFGIDVSKVVPSMESFGLEEEKKKSTAKLAERLKEILASVLKALANAYRFVIDKAEKLVHQAKNFHPILRKRIADAKKAVEAHEGDIVSITVPADLRKKLYVGKDGVVDIQKLASNDVIDVLGSFAEINDELKDFATDLNEGLRESLKGNPDQVIKVLRQVTNDAKSNFEQASASGKQNVPEGFEVPEGFKVLSSTSEIPGGQVVVNMAPAGENGEADYAKGVYGFQNARSGGDDFEGSVEAVNVSKAGIINLLNGLSSVVDRTNQIANARVNVINVYKGMTKAIESYSLPSDTDDDVTPEQVTEIKELYDRCLQITRINTKYAAANIDNAIKYVMSSLAPASLSLVSKALKKEKAEKEDKE